MPDPTREWLCNEGNLQNLTALYPGACRNLIWKWNRPIWSDMSTRSCKSNISFGFDTFQNINLQNSSVRSAGVHMEANRVCNWQCGRGVQHALKRGISALSRSISSVRNLGFHHMHRGCATIAQTHRSLCTADELNAIDKSQKMRLARNFHTSTYPPRDPGYCEQRLGLP